MLGRMFFRSCCILPLNLWDRTVEPKLPSISVPRRASSRAQQEGFIVLGPMLQGWQYVCLLSSGSWGVGNGGGVERERERGGGMKMKSKPQTQLWQKGYKWARAETQAASTGLLGSQEQTSLAQGRFLRTWLFCKISFVLYSPSNSPCFHPLPKCRLQHRALL